MQEFNRSETSPLGRIREGMHVVDEAGNDVGRVEYVQMGDEGATTTAGNEERSRGPLGVVAEAVGGEREPDVPEPLRSRLVRSGYIKVDGPNLLDTDRYVSSEHVREVSGDRVRLDIRKDEMAPED
jgi:hypothetical protein